jgi:hypothetical protein
LFDVSSVMLTSSIAGVPLRADWLDQGCLRTKATRHACE